MQTTKLILIEGISGSGKSTMAHYLSRQLDRHGIEHTWWYEEDKWHPLYPFHDAVSMQQLLDALAANKCRVFAVDSFPYKAQFGEDDKGVRTMAMTGPEQLFHEVDNIFTTISIY